jgi:hypothetical protein
MAFREGLLQKVDLLGMADLLARQQSASRKTAEEKAMMAEQLKSMQEANKMAELKRMMLTPSPSNTVLDSPYTIGMPRYQKEQENMRYLSMLTGNPLPNQGIRGSGDGGNEGGNAGDSERKRLFESGGASGVGQAANDKYGAPNIPFGYGSGNASLLAEQKIKSEADQAQKNRDAQIEITRLNSEGRNVPSAKSPTAKTSQSEIMSSGALVKIDELKKSDKFNELPIETQNAAFSDSEISKLFNDNTIDIEDIIIRLIIKYGGRPGPAISATNRKTGKQYSSEPTGDVSATVEYK